MLNRCFLTEVHVLEFQSRCFWRGLLEPAPTETQRGCGVRGSGHMWLPSQHGQEPRVEALHGFGRGAEAGSRGCGSPGSFASGEGGGDVKRTKRCYVHAPAPHSECNRLCGARNNENKNQHIAGTASFCPWRRGCEAGHSDGTSRDRQPRPAQLRVKCSLALRPRAGAGGRPALRSVSPVPSALVT